MDNAREAMSNWIESLQAQGAVINADNTVSLTAKASGGTVIPLLHQRVLTVTGPDSEKFLQGQLSCDLAQTLASGSSMGSHCNIKGHMISLFRVITIADGFMLRLHNDIHDIAAQTLGKYIIFSKAEIAKPGDAVVGIGLQGENAAELAKIAVSELPAETNGVSQQGDRTLISVPGGRYELWLPQEDAVALLPELLALGQLGDSNDWLLSEVRAAIPDLRTATIEAFIPQMTNLQALNGVSFTKGCYTGQEIVTRLQHRGQLKRPMYRLKSACDTLPQAGDTVFSDSKENAGQVVVAARNEAGECELLAVVIKEQADNDILHLQAQDGPVATVEELPYELDPKMFEAKNRL
ncbi:folate-binding protein [Pontibacterium granulatum]|uniref:CAF17-like 4Fe-4S cluster assembly/insertion protein YgfZ n=1 Tax=Pontibacterium granulatum TaxID=2036029 RepID=UPI00249B39A8|nr:folate-binding protein [Pontibacterium granulatum]MDI3323704.1 folate-binding protein [Pontibacterium granulatum]